MLRIFKDTKIDFQSKRRVAISLSGLVILIGIISLILHGGPNYSIDFEGGLAIVLRFLPEEGQPPITEEMVRNSLDKIGLTNSEVKLSRSTEGEDLLVRIKEEGRYRPAESLIRSTLEKQLSGVWRIVPDDRLDPEGMPDLNGVSYVPVITGASDEELLTILKTVDVVNPRVIHHRSVEGDDVAILAGEGKDAVSRLRRVLMEDYPDYKLEIRSIDRVGPRIGAELRLQALFAIFAALLLIVIYLWWRFELLFGIAAVIALFHDVMITLGVFSLLNLEVSITIVGAFLTLVGYSLNDTIVVFDRIRENLKKYRDDSYPVVINRSINQTLSRTIITSGTTLIVVLVLFLMGGEVLHTFALALLVGILVGTYSSIYIASPVLIEWAERTGQAAGKKMRKK